jgi:peptide/nickel transport system substrate-binding protein
MRTRRTIAAAAAGLLAASALTACSAASTSTGTTGGGTSALSNGVLNVGMPDGPETDNNNPFLSSSAAANLGYRYMIYEPLVMTSSIDPAGAGTPWLATAWNWTNNYQTLTLTIRNGVTWSDGTPLTAADVAYTFTLMKNNAALNNYGIKFGTISSSGSTVTVTFPGSQYVNQDDILSQFIVPQHIWSKISNPTTNTIANPVGSGPYTLKTFTPQTVTLARRSTYWQALPQPATIHYTSYSDNNSQTTALTSGACDWSYVFIPNPSVTYTAKDPANLKLWFPGALGINGLWINDAQAPFNNPALRQAMNLVINRGAIVQEGEDGYFYPLVTSVTGLPTGAGTPFVASQYAGKNEPDSVTQAKSVLTQAGFKYNGSTLETAAGAPVTITLTDPAGWSDYDTDLTLIQSDFAQIGITATINQDDADTWTTDIETGDFQAALRWTNSGATPYSMYEQVMDGALYEPDGTSATGNFGRFQDPAATAALQQYANASSDSARTSALNTLEQIMVQQVPIIPIMAGNAGAEYSTKTWTGWPSASNPYAPPQPTLLNDLQVVLKLKPATS